MGYKSIEILVPTSVRKDDVRLYSVSTRTDIDRAFYLFSQEHPEIYDLIEEGDPMKIADHVAFYHCISSSREGFEIIPQTITGTYSVESYRLFGDRFFCNVPINACVDADYWNCVYGAALLSIAYDKAEIKFENWAKISARPHTVTFLPGTNQTIDLLYGGHGGYVNKESLPISRSELMDKKFEPVYTYADSLYGLIIPEIIHMHHINQINQAQQTLGNALDNLALLVGETSRIPKLIDASIKIEELLVHELELMNCRL
jgi:hypothetical protein